MDKKLRELTGMTVIGSGGKIVGKVMGVEVNTQSWHVGQLRVKVRSADVKEALGLQPSFWTASWMQALIVVDTKHVNCVGDVVCLSASLEDLAKILKEAVPVEEGAEPAGGAVQEPPRSS